MTLPALSPKTSARAPLPAHVAPKAALAVLYREGQTMAQDIWQAVRTPRESVARCRAEVDTIYRTLSANDEYRRNIIGRWFNQVGGGLSHGGFLALLGHSNVVTGVAGGLLASTALKYFEDSMANLVQVHRGFIRDSGGKNGTGPETWPAQKSYYAARLILLGGLDAAVMGTALGVVACVSVGILGGRTLLMALASLQTVRTCLVIYQSACLDALKVRIDDDPSRAILTSKRTATMNYAEAGLGARLYQTTLIGCQTAAFFMPPTYQLAFTAAQIFVGMALSAAGKYQFLPFLLPPGTPTAGPMKAHAA